MADAVAAALVREERCERHGSFVSRRLAGQYWSRCDGCRLDPDPEEAAAAALARAGARSREAEERRRAAEERRAAYRDAKLRAIGLVGRYEHASFETFEATTDEQRRAARKCLEFAEQPQGGLILAGPPGTGKTHLLLAILRHATMGTLADEGKWCELIGAAELIRRVRATWRKDAEESEDEVLHNLATRYILAIDEIGVGLGTEAEQKTLFDVVDARYRRGRPTLIGSNLTLGELQQVVGERVYDRLIDGAKVVVCNWPSHRKLSA